MTDVTHSRRILRNVLFGLSTWIVPLFLGLIVTRVVVRSLGHHDYGIYALVLGFIAYSFNFSIGRAITKYLATYLAAGEIDKARSIISATAFVTLSVASLGVISIIGLSNWLVSDVFTIDAASQADALSALRLASVTIFVLMVTQIATAILQGLHRFDIYSNIQNANSIATMVGNLWLAINGYGLVAMLWWNLAAAVMTAALAFFTALKVFKGLRFGLNFDSETIKTVAKYSAGVVGYQVAANAFFLFERSWIIAKLGAETLTFYVVPMTLGLYLHGFVLSLTMALFPLASQYDNDPRKLLRLYQSATKAVLFVVVIIVTTVVTLGRLFITLWMGPEFGDRSASLLTLHIIAFGLAAISIVSFQTAEGLGRPGFNFRNTLLGVLVALPVIFVLTDVMGSIGVAYGRLVVFATLFVAIFDLEHKSLGGIQSRFWLGNLLRFGAASVCAGVVQRIVVSSLTPTWSAFLLAAVAGCIVYCISLWLAGIASDEDRRLVRRLIQREA